MTIHNQSDIIEALEAKYQELIDCIEQQALEDFNQEIVAGKWTIAQHADHLIRSTGPLNKALRMPKLSLRTMFGKLTRAEKSFEEVKEFYRVGLANGGRATGRYIPADADQGFDREKIVTDLTKELKKLTGIISKWSEAQLSSYLLPHPILGKLTIREMMFFTIYHTEHHLGHMRMMSRLVAS